MRQPVCVSLLPLALLALVGAPARDRAKTCLAFVTRNLAKGNPASYTYFTFADARVKIKEGDVLVYSILLDPANPEEKGGVDCQFTDGGKELRDTGLVDQNGIRAHGDGILKEAVGKWYERRIALDLVKDRTTKDWQVVEEGDSFGRYVQFLKNVRVEHKDGTKSVVYDGGLPVKRQILLHEGYTQYPACVAVDETLVSTDLKAAIAKADKLGVQAAKVAGIEQDLNLAREFLKSNPDPELKRDLVAAEQMLQKAASEEVTAQYLEEVLHTAQQALAHAHPEMAKYTGHLVGHAHIDLQWLWEWQEGMVATHDTFDQATKFMDEFPGFTFSQSSSCLYQAVQENWPDLFKEIQAKVKAGQWELVGGRVCEGDTNMVSAESHIRQFLYGQAYFRENFGKTARVGWEPDTFGHTIQMPQILKLGGCDAYYFCRGGKGKPLFWWKGLDGTKMLSFDEPASGSWYNSDLSYKQFQEMLDFQKKAGSKDSLMVYGIGNHGGGPSREYIETALGWMKDKNKPKVKFSTATQFFDGLRKYDLSKIPVIDQELNPVFDGCYTSQAEVKQLNRQSEFATTAAESVATVASVFGFKYPRESFRRNWEDICFNHHHDTLPGTAIHAPYERTKTVLNRVLADDKDFAMRAMETLTLRVKPEKGGFSILVFNPSGWTRSGMVRHLIGGTGWAGDGVVPSNCVAYGPDGKETPVTEVDPASHLAEFWAADVPALGWKVYHLKTPVVSVSGRSNPLGEEHQRAEGVLENDRLRVEINRGTGAIAKVFDKESNKTILSRAGLGLLELHTEHDDGMSAWVIGHVTKVEPCKVIDDEGVSFVYDVPWAGDSAGKSRIWQKFRLEGDKIVVDVDCEWHAIGTAEKGAPLLRVAFDMPLNAMTATYEVPFGALARPSDGKESAALNWADVSDGQYGIAVLNDSKHGYSSTAYDRGKPVSESRGGSGFPTITNTLRLSLIRSSTGPDPAPNQGRHHWRYVIVPHKGDWRAANLPRLGYEFQTPLMSATVPFDAHGTAPKQWSLLSASDPNVLITGVKRAEKSNDLVVHFYDAGGQGAKGSIKFNTPVSQVWNVNFLEDALSKETVTGNTVGLNLHKFEIKCLRVKA